MYSKKKSMDGRKCFFMVCPKIALFRCGKSTDNISKCYSIKSRSIQAKMHSCKQNAPFKCPQVLKSKYFR